MTLRFGLIGLGKITSRFARVLNTMEKVEIAAVASRDPSRSKKFAKEFNAKTVCNNYEEVIQSKDVDLVYIGLTNNFHYEFTKNCLERYKPVLCEKPMVTTRKEAEELVSLAQKNQTFLMEAMWTRCLPAYRKAQAWVKAGKIGQVKLITANFCFRTKYDPNHRIFNINMDGGSLFDVGVYPIDFAIGILGEHPESVCGSALIAPNGVDESAAFSMQFKSGALANLTCGYNVRAMEEAIIYGTSGRLVLENCYSAQSCFRYDEKGKLIDNFLAPVPDGFVYQIQHCADLIKKKKIESDLIPWKDTIASTAVFDALYQQWGIRSS